MGTGVYSVAIDTRRQPARLLAGVDSSHFGPIVATSDDLGETWHEPDRPPIAFPEDTGAALVRVWQIAPGAGASAGCGQRRHPSRSRCSGPRTAASPTSSCAVCGTTRTGPSGGSGFAGPAVHTVLPHPTNADSPWSWPCPPVVSTALRRWRKRLASSQPGDFGGLPACKRFPQFGQCVHKVTRDPNRPEQLFAQNHHGVYRSENEGDSWEPIEETSAVRLRLRDGRAPAPVRPGVQLPDRPRWPRFPADSVCQAYRSEDAGKTWQPLSLGLPEGPFYGAVLRDAMCVDDAETTGVYFGTRTGEVFASRGRRRELAASGRTPARCVVRTRGRGAKGPGVNAHDVTVDEGSPRYMTPLTRSVRLLARWRSLRCSLAGAATMSVTVRLPGVLAAEAGGHKTLEHEATNDLTLGAVLDQIARGLATNPEDGSVMKKGELRRIRQCLC